MACKGLCAETCDVPQHELAAEIPLRTVLGEDRKASQTSGNVVGAYLALWCCVVRGVVGLQSCTPKRFRGQQAWTSTAKSKEKPWSHAALDQDDIVLLFLILFDQSRFSRTLLR